MGEGVNTCVVCGRRETTTGHVCDLDHKRITGQLDNLAALVARLEVQLVPAGRGLTTDRVTGRRQPPLPARLDILNLLGPGTPTTTAAAETKPAVRRWRTVDTLTTADGRTVHTSIWHQEISTGETVYYSTSHGDPHHHPRPGHHLHPPSGDTDQTGIIPPRAWARAWATRWQQALGHHPRPPRRVGGWEKTWAAHFTGSEQWNPATTLGIGGYTPHSQRPDDPVGDQWRQRFGHPHPGYALTEDLSYLQRWLPAAAEHNLDVADFAAELRALTQELGQVLGDTPDQQWLGRCPTTVTDRAAGEQRPCGAGLWQDPHASQVRCTRCRSTWGPSGIDLLHLAWKIRQTWPVDRRRRYTSTERAETPDLPCPTCRQLLHLSWRDVTAAGDRERWWQPAAVVCPSGCETRLP